METNVIKDKPKKVNLLLVILIFVCGFLISQDWISHPDNLKLAQTWYQSSHETICRGNIRIPGLHCQDNDTLMYLGDKDVNRLVASAPSFAQAIQQINIPLHSDRDVVRYLMLVQSVAEGWKDQRGVYNQIKDGLIAAYARAWDANPQLVAASRCTYCGSFHDQAIINLLNLTASGWNHRVDPLVLNPRYFSAIAERDNDVDNLPELLAIHANLSSAGDSKTARTVGAGLAKHNNLQALERWVTNGLNGGRALEGLDLQTVPREVVIAAWEHGVTLGYDNVTLMEYLVSTGYRPALRWLIWLQGTDIDYIKTHSYEYSKNHYARMVSQYTNLAASENSSLGEVYSQNWQRVQWNSDQKKWLL